MSINKLYNLKRDRFISIIAIISILFTIHVPIIQARSYQNVRIISSPVPSKPPADDLTFVTNNSGCKIEQLGGVSLTIDVTRYVGKVGRLLTHGQIASTARLAIPAIDLGIYGPDGLPLPPQNALYFNNRNQIGAKQIEFHATHQGNWLFDIPIELVNFPSDPGIGGTIRPEPNIIWLQTNTASTQWCNPNSWSALRIAVVDPIMLVHGILSYPETWGISGSNQQAWSWVQALEQEGRPFFAIDIDKDRVNLGKEIPTEAVLSAGGVINVGLDSLQNNAAQIDLDVEMLRRRWGVDKLIIVGHSKGGLDARYYIEKYKRDTVSTLIQIASPNAGSPLADVLQIGAAIGIDRVSEEILHAIDPSSTQKIDSLGKNIQWFLAPAMSQLTQNYMRNYNQMYSQVSSTDYWTVSGDYRHGNWIVKAGFDFFYSGANDQVVPVRSVQALSQARHRIQRSTGANTQARHTQINKSIEVKALLSEPLNRLRTTDPYVSKPATDVSTTLSPVAVSNFEQTETIMGAIAQGEIKTHTIMIDETSESQFILYHNSTQTLEFSLISPSGIKVDMNSSTLNGNYSYNEIDMGEFKFLIYNIAQSVAEKGHWKAITRGLSIIPESSVFFLTAQLRSNALQVQSSTNKTLYERGEAIRLTTTIREHGIPVTSAQVIAQVIYPDGKTSASITLSDSDNDGIYSGQLDNTWQAGTYQVSITASGSSQQPFSRSNLLSVPVSSSKSKFRGHFTDYGSDTDGNDLFNHLIITADIDITERAEYRVFGELVDRNGSLIQQVSLAQTLDPGLQTVRLSVDGSLIRKNEINGPYTLKTLRLAEQNDNGNIVILDELSNVYQTRHYQAENFQSHSSVHSVFGDVQATPPGGIFPYKVVIDGRDAASGQTLYAQEGVCNDFNIESNWSISNISDGTRQDVYGGWGPSAVNDGIYQASNVTFSREKVVGPGSSEDGGYSAKISSNQPHAARLGSPIIRIAPGSQITVKANYLMRANHSNSNSEWVSMGVKPDAAGQEAQYVNGHARGHWAQLEHTVTAGPTGEVMVLLQAQSKIAVNSNIYFDDVRIYVDDEPLASCVYESR